MPEAWEAIISLGTVVSLHDEAIRLHGGKPSGPYEGCLEGGVGNSYNAALYSAQSDPPSSLEISLPFAGYLLFYLAKDSCFVDGNKRVAWSSATHILTSFGLTLDASEDEAVELVLGVVEGRIESGAEVVSWLEKHLVAIPFDDDSGMVH